jgi:hypothetical protein
VPGTEILGPHRLINDKIFIQRITSDRGPENILLLAIDLAYDPGQPDRFCRGQSPNQTSTESAERIWELAFRCGVQRHYLFGGRSGIGPSKSISKIVFRRLNVSKRGIYGRREDSAGQSPNWVGGAWLPDDISYHFQENAK